MGWQPSRFLTDRAEAEHAFQAAERLGSVNAAAAELGRTWPSLRKAFQRHGLGIPARNPEAVRQRVVDTARQRSGQPATPSLDPVFAALNPGALPARERSPAELYQWVRREEQYATLGASVVVELNSESHARQPTTRAWAILRRADRSHRLASQSASRGDRRPADRTSRPRQPQERGWLRMLDDPAQPRPARRLPAGDGQRHEGGQDGRQTCHRHPRPGPVLPIAVQIEYSTPRARLLGTDPTSCIGTRVMGGLVVMSELQRVKLPASRLTDLGFRCPPVTVPWLSVRSKVACRPSTAPR
jgi:hypothetical protein